METCDTSLGDLIEEQDSISAGPLEPAKILKVCSDISAALDYLHTKAFLLHGDLKSYNVLIKNSFEQCKLCDFGVSLPLNSEGYIDLEKNPKARYIGTDIYSAPEVFHSPLEDISSKCDIFSFGLIIFECLTLRPPHYEHLQGNDVSGISSENDTSILSDVSLKLQAKKLFSESEDSKENMLNLSSIVANSSKETTLNGSQAENSILIKSTAATIGDDTIQDITGTTFNGTINTATDVSFESNSTNRHPMRDINASFNSTLGSESDSCALDKSVLGLDDTTETIENWYGTRPCLPDNQQFDNEYLKFCEAFFLCTHALPEERPTAGDLLINFKKFSSEF